MNRLILRLLACVAVTQVGAAGAAVASHALSPDDEAWGRTVSVDTLEAYAKFSLDFPDSRHADQARARLTALTDADAKRDVASHEPFQSSAPEFVPNSLVVV